MKFNLSKLKNYLSNKWLLGIADNLWQEKKLSWVIKRSGDDDDDVNKNNFLEL
mgnify:CR=1 FL=1